LGLKITTTKEEVFRSVLEGVAFNLKIILDVFDNLMPLDEVIVIGGGARSRVWLQILADIWQKSVFGATLLRRSHFNGSRHLWRVGIGAFGDFKVAKKFNEVVEEIKPRQEYREVYERLFTIFDQTYEALLPVYANLAKLES